ncbi:MAG: LptF/LptG family permease [Ignavibacteriae bacterium]|nr:LptF/LptG family permease [Ignavibacteriota bacterium]
MKLIDKYILKHFIQNFLFGLSCFVLIFILVDLFENMDKFIDKKLSLPLLALYYAYFIPDILKLITPVGILLASLFTISRFVNYSELTAMKSAGISIYRYLLPIITVGMIITLFSVYFNGWIVPKTNHLKYNFDRNYLGRNSIPNSIQNIYIQDKKNRIITINTYDKIALTCSNTSIQIFNPDTLFSLKARYDIESMKWDSTRNDWFINKVYERLFYYAETESLKTNFNLYISDLKYVQKISIDPSQIEKRQLRPEELVLSDFRQFIDNLEESGQDAAKEKVDYYSIISFPFANLVTIIFGVSISSNRRKAGAALHFGISLIVSFFYLGFVKISQVFGYNGDLNPILTAWLANILFLAISLANFYRLNRI